LFSLFTEATVISSFTDKNSPLTACGVQLLVYSIFRSGLVSFSQQFLYTVVGFSRGFLSSAVTSSFTGAVLPSSSVHSSLSSAPLAGLTPHCRISPVHLSVRYESKKATKVIKPLPVPSFESSVSPFLCRLHRDGPRKRKRKRKSATGGKPFIKGVVLKTVIKKPKKPNSANRKCVRVRLSTGREAVAYVPGIGHNLQEHHIVLVRGGRVQDCPGVKLKCVRGKYDLQHVKKVVQ